MPVDRRTLPARAVEWAIGRRVALAPLAAMVAIHLISPGIRGRTHAHSGRERHLRIGRIDSLVPPVPTCLWRLAATNRRADD